MSFRLTHIHDYHRFIAVDLGMYRVRAAMYNVQEGLLTCTGFSSIRQSRKNFIYGEIADIQGIAQSIEYAILKA
jgi:cell division ATPase FtsA